MAAGPTRPISAVRIILTDALPLPTLPEQREEEDGSRDSIPGCHGVSLHRWRGRAALVLWFFIFAAITEGVL